MPCEGKTLQVRNTKGESTDGHDGGGSSGSSDEALVTSVERSGCSMTAGAHRAIGQSNRFQRRLSSQEGREMASRVNREVVLWAAGGEIPPADPAAWNPILATQIPLSSWHGAIGDATYADAILDRIVHAAYRVELQGDSLRKPSRGVTASSGSAIDQPASHAKETTLN